VLVLITCWSSKGGSGTTVVAAAVATLLAAQGGGSLLVDLGGDLPAALGLADPPLGLATWKAGASEPGAAAHLRRLEMDVGTGVRLVPRGHGPLATDVGPALAQALGERERVVVDAGVIGDGGRATPAFDLAASATRSLLVLRPCFLALRRAAAAPIRSSGVVLIDEPQRVLGPGDIQAALGVPVVAVVPWDPAVARRVDAGLLGASLPRAMSRALQPVLGGHLPGLRHHGGPHRPEAVA
jgi:hypothetical protein